QDCRRRSWRDCRWRRMSVPIKLPIKPSITLIRLIGLIGLTATAMTRTRTRTAPSVWRTLSPAIACADLRVRTCSTWAVSTLGSATRPCVRCADSRRSRPLDVSLLSVVTSVS
ncbi:MAG: hypothetical protein MHM6MM_009158, partial [Cercozoa sp. M6MM]